MAHVLSIHLEPVEGSEAKDWKVITLNRTDAYVAMEPLTWKGTETRVARFAMGITAMRNQPFFAASLPADEFIRTIDADAAVGALAFTRHADGEIQFATEPGKGETPAVAITFVRSPGRRQRCQPIIATPARFADEVWRELATDLANLITLTLEDGHPINKRFNAATL